MQVFDWLYPNGRAFDRSAIEPEPGLSACRVSAVDFFAIKPNTGGERDLTNLDQAEAKKWADGAPDGAPLILEIEVRRDPHRREIYSDVRRFSGKQVMKDASEHTGPALRMVKAHARGPVLLYGETPNMFNIQNAVILQDVNEIKRATAAALFYRSCGGIAESTDGFAPSLYATTEDPAVWVRTVRTVEQILRLLGGAGWGYPFVSPVYHPSVPRVGGTLVPISYWRTMLAMLHAFGFAGCVAWAGNNTAPVWAEFKPYLEAAQETAALPPADE